jgi:hypothetical protein
MLLVSATELTQLAWGRCYIAWGRPNRECKLFSVLNDETQNTTPFSKGSIIIKSAISMGKIYFRIKLHKLCDMSGYTYYMNIDLGKDRICVCDRRYDTNTCRSTTTDRKVEGHVCKLYMANLFLLSELLNNLKERKEEIVAWPSDVKNRNARDLLADLFFWLNGDRTFL